MKITLKWLEEQGACEDGRAWFKNQKSSAIKPVILKLITEKRFTWANWTLTHLFSHKQNVKYACFSAIQVLKEFEKAYPQDNRPRNAIKAALIWAEYPTKENQIAAESAARSAWAAARSAAWSAESAVQSAARSAARSAESAAAWSAAWKTILFFGLKLLSRKFVKLVLK